MVSFILVLSKCQMVAYLVKLIACLQPVWSFAPICCPIGPIFSDVTALGGDLWLLWWPCYHNWYKQNQACAVIKHVVFTFLKKVMTNSDQLESVSLDLSDLFGQDENLLLYIISACASHGIFGAEKDYNTLCLISILPDWHWDISAGPKVEDWPNRRTEIATLIFMLLA